MLCEDSSLKNPSDVSKVRYFLRDLFDELMRNSTPVHAFMDKTVCVYRGNTNDFRLKFGKWYSNENQKKKKLGVVPSSTII